MATTVTAVAAALMEIADLLELRASNPHRVQAYRTAAQAVRALPVDFVEKMVRGEPTRVRGVGRGMLDKIGELVRNGSCVRLRELRRAVPVASRRLLNVPGLGPSRIRRLTQALPLRTMRDLKSACRGQRIRAIVGFGPRTEANILNAITNSRAGSERFDRRVVAAQTLRLLRYLRRLEGISVTIAGSYRRGQETIGDVDVLVAARNAARVVEHFSRYEHFTRVSAAGAVRATGYLAANLQVDLRVVSPSVHGAALVYFTGSKAHNIELRRIARRRGLKLNEYGLFRGDRLIAGATEQSVYRALKLRWVPPEAREGLDSIQLIDAREGHSGRLSSQTVAGPDSKAVLAET